MRKCGACGKEFEGNFCPECGKKFEEEAACAGGVAGGSARRGQKACGGDCSGGGTFFKIRRGF